MNFIRFRGRAAKGAESVRLRDRDIRIPRLEEDLGETELALGIRPEHIRFAQAGELAGSVYGVEYLGTTQIVTVETPDGLLKARVPAERRVRPGESVHLALDTARLSLFDAASGRAIRSQHRGEPPHG
jgi:multiple sugar transport system ATP-binding protein